MAISRNGWDVYSSGSNSKLVNFPWVTGKVRGGDHYVVLDYIAKRWNAEVETIRKDWSWGYANRAVRGASVISEHATGTAVDFNAPLHGLGQKNTFSASDQARIRQIMKDVSHAARWGGEWSRPDDMHVELIGGNALIGRVADQIRAGKLPGAGSVKPAGNVKPSKPKPKPSSRPTDYKDLAVDGKFGGATAEAVQILMSQIGLYEREIDKDAGRHTWEAVQEWLNGLGYYDRAVDGNFGYHSIVALQQFLASKGHLDTKKWLIDGKFGKETIKAFQRYLSTQNGK